MNEPLLQHFAYVELPEEVQTTAKAFSELAVYLCTNCPCNPERTLALKRLVEAKDFAIRAQLWKESGT